MDHGPGGGGEPKKKRRRGEKAEVVDLTSDAEDEDADSLFVRRR
jgi:hypothetical protein